MKDEFSEFLAMSKDEQRAHILNITARCVDGAPVSLARKIELFLGETKETTLDLQRCKCGGLSWQHYDGRENYIPSDAILSHPFSPKEIIMQMYMVGGKCRDDILGLPSKDIDFSCVLEQADIDAYSAHNQFTPFEYMVEYLKGQGFKIFLETPEYLTVRAQFPTDGPHFWKTLPHSGNRLTADFVLARKESDYTDGRRPEVVEPGTLMDDLARRDLTMNAIAKDSDGNYIDPFNGLLDIEAGIIRAVGDPFERLNEDALRAVRALRFSVTKGFVIEENLAFYMQSTAVLDKIADKISDERIKDELSKMFRYDTVASLDALSQYPRLTRAMFSGTVSLDATMRTKGRGTDGRQKIGKRPLPEAHNNCQCRCHQESGVKHLAACCRKRV